MKERSKELLTFRGVELGMRTYDCSLYLITPPMLDPDFPEQLKAALDAGDVAALQLRLKDVADEEICRAVDLVRPIAQSRGVALILNDRPDLAVQTGCDGAQAAAVCLAAVR